jgi:hypothetical protein
MQVNNSTTFHHSASRPAVFREDAYFALFMERVWNEVSAHKLLDMSDAKLTELLNLIDEELCSFSNPYHWALEKLFGQAHEPPTKMAVRRAARARVKIADAYWGRRMKRHAAKLREDARAATDEMEDLHEAGRLTKAQLRLLGIEAGDL